MYMMSIVEMTEIKKQVQGLLDQGVIKPSSSPYGSRIMMVQRNMAHGECVSITGP
jgi:hypothetical protein